MSKEKSVKTNAMRMLDRAKIPYEPVFYDLGDAEFSGELVSELTGIDPARSFKTLCTRGEKRGILIFVVPVAAELDLKAAAAAAGDKRVELVPTKEVLGLTGYVRGGVSPVGMKKQYPTFIDSTAELFETIAIKTVFKEHAREMKINSTKSMIGHLLGAAGAVEFIACVKELNEGFIHETVGYKVPDEECDLDYVTNGPIKMDIRYALSNSLGFGGHNASLLVKKFEE